MWHQSPLYKDLPQLCHIDGLRIDKTFHIIGDSAYPLSNNLMIPYKYRKKKSLTQQQKTFNTNLASKRSVIERAFGLLGIRFPRLTHITSRTNEKRIKIVVAACILHNWCIMEDDIAESIFHLADHDEIETDVNDHIPASLMADTRRPTAGGNTKRDMLSAIIST